MFIINNSDLIQIIAILISLLVSTVSIWQTKKSIRMTEEAYRDANRPVLAFYVEIIDTTLFGKYIVLKNFGNTSANILDLKLEGLEKDRANQSLQLQSLKGGHIAPGQKFSTAVEGSFKEDVHAYIKYQQPNDNSKKKYPIYTERITLKLGQTHDMLWVKDQSQDRSDEAKAINNAAHAIVKAIK